MTDLNITIRSGNLTKDPEYGITQVNKKPVMTFTIASNYGYGDYAKKAYTVVSVYGKRAEGLVKLELKKGDKVTIQGEIELDAYIDKDQQPAACFKMDNPEKVDLMSRYKPSQASNQGQRNSGQSRSQHGTNDGSSGPNWNSHSHDDNQGGFDHNDPFGR